MYLYILEEVEVLHDWNFTLKVLNCLEILKSFSPKHPFQRYWYSGPGPNTVPEVVYSGAAKFCRTSEAERLPRHVLLRVLPDPCGSTLRKHFFLFVPDIVLNISNKISPMSSPPEAVLLLPQSAMQRCSKETVWNTWKLKVTISRKRKILYRVHETVQNFLPVRSGNFQLPAGDCNLSFKSLNLHKQSSHTGGWILNFLSE